MEMGKTEVLQLDNRIAYFKNNYGYYALLIGISLLAYLILNFAYLMHDFFEKIMSVATYLAWHNIFEFAGILVCFAVFVVSYYTYDQTRNLRVLFLGSVFLIIGLIQAFHTLSFKGMPDFFIPNDSANRATTFWIISRVIESMGFVVSMLIGVDKRSTMDKRIFLGVAAAISFAVFITVTFYSDLIPPMYIEGHGLTELKVILEYIIMFFLFLSVVLLVNEYNKLRDPMIIWITVALVFGIFGEYAFISYYRVYDIYNYIGHIYICISSFIIFRVIFIYNVQKPYLELEKTQDQLRTHVENLDRIVDKRTKELKHINQKLIEDLEYARDIQKAMLPLSLPNEREVSFEARYFPAEKVSGDFYNIFKLDDQHIGMYIGDVSGHGVPAAMLTVFLNQSIKAVKDVEGSKFEIIAPSEVLKSVYHSFNKTNFKEEVYVVLLYAVYNIMSRELTYSSAGLNVAPLILGPSGQVNEISISGFPICKFMEYYDVNYTDSTIRLGRGDRVLFYTDGLTEAERGDGESFSETRLKEMLTSNHDKPGALLTETIVKGIFDFMGSMALKDDITFYVMNVE